MIADKLLYVLPLLFVVAALYSSVGHGGASGYLAVLSFLGIAIPPLVPVVLMMNIIVASISFLHFRKPGDFSIRTLLPFVVTSIPAAYVGGMHKVSDIAFAVILGLALLAAGIRLLGFQATAGRRSFDPKMLWLVGLPVGAVLGLVSGMIGIGGGVFLSPILIFSGLTDTKGSAALSSAFIVINSLSGLAGASSHFDVSYSVALPMVAAGAVGALVGANWGAMRAQAARLQAVLGCVLILASVKLLSGIFTSAGH